MIEYFHISEVWTTFLGLFDVKMSDFTDLWGQNDATRQACFWAREFLLIPAQPSEQIQ